jgi:hypothetical protein
VADWNGKLRVVDISDLAAPIEIGACEELPATAVDVSLQGDFAVVSCAGNGLYIVDVSTPSLPVVVGYYNTPGFANHVTVADGYAYVADSTYFGIYDISAALGASDSFIPHPSSFILSAFPNPFNATAQIRFDVPRSSFVNIAVYDLQGRLVDELASRVFDAGTHTINYDASARASGMYFVQMESGNFSSAQKLMLLK